MDIQIERIVKNNPALDGAEAITMSITRRDRTRAHYYIFKEEGYLEKDETVKVPLSLMMKENGKGRNRHYILVVAKFNGYMMFDLNRDRRLQLNGKYVTLYDPDTIKLYRNIEAELPF